MRFATLPPLTTGVVGSRGATRRRRPRGEALCGGARQAVAGRLVEARGEAAGALHGRWRRVLGQLLQNAPAATVRGINSVHVHFHRQNFKTF